MVIIKSNGNRNNFGSHLIVAIKSILVIIQWWRMNPFWLLSNGGDQIHFYHHLTRPGKSDKGERIPFPFNENPYLFFSFFLHHLGFFPLFFGSPCPPPPPLFCLVFVSFVPTPLLFCFHSFVFAMCFFPFFCSHPPFSLFLLLALFSLLLNLAIPYDNQKKSYQFFWLPKVEIFWSPQGWAIENFGHQKV